MTRDHRLSQFESLLLSETTEQLANNIFRRLELRYPDVVSNYGHEVVGDAVNDTASFHGGAEEYGTSDIGGMVREVIQSLERQYGARAAADQPLPEDGPPHRDMGAELKAEIRKSEKMQNATRVVYYVKMLHNGMVAVASYENFINSWAGQEWFKKHKPEIENFANVYNKRFQKNYKIEDPTRSNGIAATLNELSTTKLAQYKTAASKDASKADKAGNFKRGDKRFSGIVKATNKQFANDAKGVKEAVGNDGYHQMASWSADGVTHKRWDKDHQQGGPADRHQSSVLLWQERGKDPVYKAHHRIEKGFWTNQSSREDPTTVTHRSTHSNIDDAKMALQKHTDALYKQDVAEGNNSSTYDQMANLKAKSNKELNDLIAFWNDALAKRPDNKVAVNQLAIIKMLIASRIGKKVAEGDSGKLSKNSEDVVAEGVFDRFKKLPEPAAGARMLITVAGRPVEITRVGVGGDHIGYSWFTTSGKERYEEARMIDHKNLHSLVSTIADEIAYAEKTPTNKVAEGWKEGAGATVLIGLLSLGAINRVSDLVNAATTGEPTQVITNRVHGVNKINAIKTVTGQGVESIKSINNDGDKKFQMTLTDGRTIIFTTSDLERAKKIAAARQASDPVEVKEGDRVKTPSGNYKNLHTGVTYSGATGQDGNDSYMTPSYMLDFYKKRLEKIAAGPHRYPAEVARIKTKIAKLERQGA